ncbi:hypothetical protein [Domibacillus iocasae]|nr:hypothetical protein [Domibacillus iocasae]
MLEWFLYDYYKREEEEEEVIDLISRLIKVDEAVCQSNCHDSKA